MEADIVYTVGLVVALLFVVFGLDDLLWDVFSLFRRIGRERVPLALVNEKPPKMLAVAVAAWQEDAVIGEVIDNLVSSVQYPRDMYRVFLGVYPNDEPTLAVARSLEQRHGSTVVAVVNTRPGPTSKADNMNAVLDAVQRYERDHNLLFAAVTLHDAEDVVHPNELKMTNYLIDDYDALQFPVFPLQRRPRLRLFFKTLTSATYADEFAEHHYRTLVMRDEFAFVPSAGTGFALGRRVLDAFAGKDVLPEHSLTEDYLLSFSLHLQGFRVHYVLEKVPRMVAQGSIVWDYIATRSMFPATFKAAVRQKARWVYGITMQSTRFRDVFGRNGLTFAERAFLYKDLKAKFANFALLPGYAVFLYFLVQTFAPDLGLPVMFPTFSFSWWLCILLLFMMLERQALRARALVGVYGWRTMALSTFVPPVFPLRLLWGNLINLRATMRAWGLKFSHDRKAKGDAGHEAPPAQSAPPQTRASSLHTDARAGSSVQEVEGGVEGAQLSAPAPKSPAWNKTDHEFLPESVLVRYRRLLGDTLLERHVVQPAELEAALARSQRDAVPLGQALLADGNVMRRHMTQALALHEQSMFVELRPELVRPDLLRLLPPEALSRYKPLPLVVSAQGWIMAVADDASAQDRNEIKRLVGVPVFFLYASATELRAVYEEAAVAEFLARAGNGGAVQDRPVSFTGQSPECDASSIDEACQLLATGRFLGSAAATLGQAGLALGYALHLERPVEDVIREMGLAVPLSMPRERVGEAPPNAVRMRSAAHPSP